MKQRLWEMGKNIIIVLLALCLLLLSAASIPAKTIREVPWLAQLLAPVLGLSEAELTPVAEAEPVMDAARPIAISCKTLQGRYTAMWDFAALDSVFDRCSSLLGQAMEQAETFTKVDAARVREAVSTESIYFCYDAPLPLCLLAHWLDAVPKASPEAVDTCILTSQNGSVHLLLQAGDFYEAATALPAAELEAVVQAMEPDGSRFAFEAGSSLADLSLLSGTAAAVPAYSAADPCDSQYINTLATILGFNPYGEGRYTDDTGTVRFSETNADLTIAPGGLVTFTDNAGRRTADGLELEALTEEARKLVEDIFAPVGGDGRLYLYSLTQSGETVTCTFRYMLSGVPVHLSRPAAEVTLRGKAVIQAQVQLYAFTATGKTIYPLPPEQAAAVLDPGSRLKLAYSVQAGGAVTAGWQP